MLNKIILNPVARTKSKECLSENLDMAQYGIIKWFKSVECWLDRKAKESEEELYVYEQSRDKAREDSLLERLQELEANIDKTVQKFNQIKSPVIRERLAKDPLVAKYVSTSVDANGNTIYKFKREELAKDPVLSQYVTIKKDSNGNTVYSFK